MNTTARNTVIGSVVLLILIVGGGIGYTWYMGQHGPKNPAALAGPLEVAQAPVLKAPKPAANANQSAFIQSLTSPVEPGSNASVIIKTNPESECKITVIYDTTASKDSGLAPKTADDFGVVSWAWTVEESVPLGKWPVTITCEHNKKSAVVIGDLKVAKPVTATN